MHSFMSGREQGRVRNKYKYKYPVNMPLTQVNTNDDRPRPLYLLENIYYELQLVFTCNTSVGETNWEILSRRYTGKRVSVLKGKNGVQFASMLSVIASTLTDFSHIVADFWPFELSYRYYLNEEEKLYPQAN